MNTNMSNGPNTNVNNGPNSATTSPMPQWAAAMCQQLQTIQIQLETQNKRWQTVEGQLYNQNTRMTQIESQISQLNNMSKKMSKTTAKVQNVESEVSAVKTKLNDYNQSVNYYSDICDSILSKNTEFEDRVNQLDETVLQMDEALLDIQWRSMRENLVFGGIKETFTRADQPEDCESILRTFLSEVMDLSKYFEFDRVHRLGRFRPGNSRPRPIVAKFTFYRDKEFVRHQAPKVLIGTEYSVNEQFPKAIEDRRKVLYPIAKNARRNESNKVRLVRDKLYINGQLHIPDDSLTQQQQSQQNPARRGFRKPRPLTNKIVVHKRSSESDSRHDPVFRMA